MTAFVKTGASYLSLGRQRRVPETLEQGTTLTLDASIADIINLRNEHALKPGSRCRGSPDVGEIAVGAAREFDAKMQIQLSLL